LFGAAVNPENGYVSSGSRPPSRRQRLVDLLAPVGISPSSVIVDDDP